MSDAKDQGVLLLLSPSLWWAVPGSLESPVLGLIGIDFPLGPSKRGCEVVRNSSSGQFPFLLAMQRMFGYADPCCTNSSVRLSSGEGEGGLGPGYSQAVRQSSGIPWRCMGAGSEP